MLVIVNRVTPSKINIKKKDKIFGLGDIIQRQRERSRRAAVREKEHTWRGSGGKGNVTQEHLLRSLHRDLQSTNKKARCTEVRETIVCTSNNQNLKRYKRENKQKEEGKQRQRVRRPASVSNGDWYGNNTRTGRVVRETDFDFGYVVALPLRDQFLPSGNCLPEPWMQARTIRRCPDSYSADKSNVLPVRFAQRTCDSEVVTVVLRETVENDNLATHAIDVCFHLDSRLK